MNPVLYPILKLLSRPVVCTNFQGLETNILCSASAFDQGHSRTNIDRLNLVAIPYQIPVVECRSRTEVQQYMSMGRQTVAVRAERAPLPVIWSPMHELHEPAEREFLLEQALHRAHVRASNTMAW